MLSLVSGQFPSSPHEVAVTAGVASGPALAVGKTWNVGAMNRQVVGIVEKPSELARRVRTGRSGQVTNPTQVTALFDVSGSRPPSDFSRRLDQLAGLGGPSQTL